MALVPTMGALHDGHLALVDAAKSAADAVVVSIFVNPLQFGPNEDFTQYPRTLESDSAKLSERGATLVFTPTAEEIYGNGSSRTTVAPRSFGTTFEGAVRPGHFAGCSPSSPSCSTSCSPMSRSSDARTCSNCHWSPR